MKHLEVSRKIILHKAATAADIKDVLLRRLEKTVQIVSFGERAEQFRVTGTTGAPASLTRHAYVDLDVEITLSDDTARIIISGYARPARSLSCLYWAMFFIVLLVGLLPGSIETSADTSDSLDVLVLLIFGVFIVLDVNKKLDEPRLMLASVLESLDTTFG